MQPTGPVGPACRLVGAALKQVNELEPRAGGASAQRLPTDDERDALRLESEFAYKLTPATAAERTEDGDAAGMPPAHRRASH